MKIKFKYQETRLKSGLYSCKVTGLGEEVRFTSRTIANTYFRKQAEAHIVIKRLRVLFHQRQVAYQIMSVNDERMETLQRLMMYVNSITLVSFEKLYEYIDEHSDEFLLVCPVRRGSFNHMMEQIVVHAIMELESKRM